MGSWYDKLAQLWASMELVSWLLDVLVVALAAWVVCRAFSRRRRDHIGGLTPLSDAWKRDMDNKDGGPY